MAKKRVIYTLLYCDGNFMLSRNFRLQRAGDVNWLLRNYNFRTVAASIDELAIIDVSRGERNRSKFLSAVGRVIDCCFVPVTLGGGIESFDAAAEFVASGADKLVLNTAFDRCPEVVRRIADVYGSQCVVGAMDLKLIQGGGYEVRVGRGEIVSKMSPVERLRFMTEAGAGELLLQSVDKDGTGFGFDLDMLATLNIPSNLPLILFGGCGRSEHMLAALRRSDVDAVATANLFNFIGDGLQRARRELMASGHLQLAHWSAVDIENLKGCVVS